MLKLKTHLEEVCNEILVLNVDSVLLCGNAVRGKQIGLKLSQRLFENSVYLALARFGVLQGENLKIIEITFK